MKEIFGLIGKHIDFYFSLALIVILGTAGSLYLQFNEANNEFETLNVNATMYSVMRSRQIDWRDDVSISYELDELAKLIDGLKF